MKITAKRINIALSSLDPSLVDNAAAQVLMVSILTGARHESQFSGLKVAPDELRTIMRRYHESGIWDKHGKVSPSVNIIELNMLVLVGEGELLRFYCEAGREWVYFLASQSAEEIKQGLMERGRRSEAPDACVAVDAPVESGLLDVAEVVTDNALERCPGPVGGYTRLGLSYEKRGEKRMAADCYRSAVSHLQLSPGDAEPEVESKLAARIAELDPPSV